MKTETDKKIILYVVNTAEFFLSHRLALALEASSQNYEIHIATPRSDSIEQISSYGFTHHVLGLSRKGKNIFYEMLSLINLISLFRFLRPDIVHLVSIKPVLYGGIASRITGVPAVVFAISGLGSTFIEKSYRARLLLTIIKNLYRFALNHKNGNVIVQNEDDRDVISSMTKNSKLKISLIRGSGVDLETFIYEKESVSNNLEISFIGRLIRDKGIFDFIEASRRILADHKNIDFNIIGEMDPGNPTSLTLEEIDEINSNHNISFLGYREDIREIILRSNIIVLPSYREGLPKVLVEAAACGRPTVTNDVPGCRDAIIHGETGFIVPPGDIGSLANAIEKLILDSELRKVFGLSGRLLAERDFDVRKIAGNHISIYDQLIANLNL